MKTTSKKKQNRIPINISIHLRYLYQDKHIRGKELLKLYPKYSKASIYRHARKPIQAATQTVNNMKRKVGRPSKLTCSDKHAILREILKLRETVGSFTAKRLREAAGVTTNVCDETVRRFLHSAGYHYFHSRKKGLLTRKDLSEGLKFARKAKRLPHAKELWLNGICILSGCCRFPA